MTSHADVGELSFALREYERCRALLADELGIDPSPQTREVHLALLRSQRRVPRHIISKRSAQLVGTARTTEALTTEPNGGDDLAVSNLLMARDCTLRRELTRAQELAEEVARTAALPDLRARAIVSSWLPNILLGGARDAREPLAHATSDCRTGR